MSKLEAMLEGERRGILPPEMQELLAEGRKRGLIPATAQPAARPYVNGSHIPQPDEAGTGAAAPKSRTGDFLKPLFGGHNPIAETYDDFVEPMLPGGRSSEDQQWMASRGVGSKLGEAAAFGLSLPGRMLTKGEYGIGDSLKSLGLTSAGEAASGAEADFMRAYRPQLEAIGKAGEVALAGQGAAMPRPSYPRAPRLPAQQTPAAAAAARRQPIANAAERLDDIDAFRDLGMQPFGPALNDKGVAKLARTVEDLPVLGNPIKRAKEGVETGLRDRRDALTRDLGSVGTDEATGRLIQGGLDRYRTARLQDLEPGDVRGLGVNPQAPSRTRAMGAKAASRSAEAEPVAGQIGANVVSTNRGARRTAAPQSTVTGSGRSTIGALSDVELGRVIQTPSHTTSFATRAEALYEKSFRGQPRLRQADGTPDPMHIDPTNTRRSIRSILDNEASAGVRSGVLQGRFGPALGRIVNIASAPGGDASLAFTVPNLRAFRTEIGKALARFDDYDTGLDRQALSRIYASASDDLEIGLRDLANRAVLGVKNGTVKPEVAQRATQSVRDFQTANRYFRAGMNRMEQFQGILDTANPDEAARKIGRALREQTSNMGAVRTILGVLRPAERQAVIGHVIGSWGRSRIGHGDFEQVFNFVNWRVEAEKVLKNPEAARLMMEPLEPAQRKALVSMLRVAKRMEAYERRKNYVNAGIGLSGVSVAGMSMAYSTATGALAAVGAVGGAALLGHFLTSPRYVSWLERHYRAGRLTPRQRAGALRQSLMSLRQIARGDPERGDEILRAIGAMEQPSQPLALPAPGVVENDDKHQLAVR